MTTENNNVQVNIENIIGDIRKQILDQRFKETGKMSQLKVDGDYFSADFYENLYQASISQQSLMIQVTQTNTPIIGGLIDKLRTMIHQVILFYLNQVVGEQARINQLNVQLINELSLEVEKIGRQLTHSPSQATE